MPLRRTLLLLLPFCMLAAACDRTQPKKPDPTKGSVMITVLSSDTGKPARFATVELIAVPSKSDKVDSDYAGRNERGTTDLNGQLDMQAVAPGHYYAYATLDGYLEPNLSLDWERIQKLSGDRAMVDESLAEWKDLMAEITIRAHRAATVTVTIQRSAAIAGAVTYDDGSPAIGMHFKVFRKSEKGAWNPVGSRLFGDWTLKTTSDGNGRYNITGIPAGEYTVCALLPLDSEDTATPICLGNVLRRKDAASVKVSAGETATGQDIQIPLSGLHTVAGVVSVLADGHAPKRAMVRLLYADDRAEARNSWAGADGQFSFRYVPEGNYFVAVTDAEDRPDSDDDEAGKNAQPATPVPITRYTRKEVPLQVQSDIADVTVQLVPEKTSTPQP